MPLLVGKFILQKQHLKYNIKKQFKHRNHLKYNIKK